MIRSGYITFNIYISKTQALNEIMIRDSYEWAAARGVSVKKIYSNLDQYKVYIEVCYTLINFTWIKFK